VRAHTKEQDTLELQDIEYPANEAEEHFLSFATSEDRLAAYLRLSLPGVGSPSIGFPDLDGAALVREVHVYGQSLSLGSTQEGAVQHRGLGSKLMERAEGIAKERGFSRVAVIAALGTRDYYRKLGYRLGESYMIKELQPRDHEAERGATPLPVDPAP
jgi:elongator complex protein 3